MVLAMQQMIVKTIMVQRIVQSPMLAARHWVAMGLAMLQFAMKLLMFEVVVEPRMVMVLVMPIAVIAVDRSPRSVMYLHATLVGVLMLSVRIFSLGGHSQ